jgi:hypothetical protein
MASEKRGAVESRSLAIRETHDARIGELAANLADKVEARPFRGHEIKGHALVHRVAAKAVEQARRAKQTRLLPLNASSGTTPS